MTRVELVNRVLAERNITVDELCFALNISSRRMHAFLDGKKTLSKKINKRLSCFAGVSPDKLATDDFTLPDDIFPDLCGLQNDVSLQDNHEARYTSFLKASYNRFNQLGVTATKIFNIVFTIYYLCLGAGAAWLCLSTTPFGTTLTYCLVTVFMCVLACAAAAGLSGFSFKNKILCDKAVKVSATVWVVAFALWLIVSLIIGELPLSVALINVLCVAYLVYRTVTPMKDYSEKNVFLSMYLSYIIIFLWVFFNFYYCDQLVYENDYLYMLPERNALIFMGDVAPFIFALVVLKVFRDLSAQKHAAMHLFGVDGETQLKPIKPFKVVICALVATIVAAIGLHIGVVLEFEKWSDKVYQYKPKTEYSGQGTVYSDSEKTHSVGVGDFSVSVPDNLKEVVSSSIPTVYRNDAQTQSVSVGFFEGGLEHESIAFTHDSLAGFLHEKLSKHKEYADARKVYGEQLFVDLEEYITEEYGFYPQSEWEFYEFEKTLREKDVNYLSKKDVFAKATYGYVFRISQKDFDDVQLLETDDICGVLTYEEREDGEFVYLFRFSEKGSNELECQLVISAKDSDNAKTLAYKVINSIEKN